jgi:twitching motility protein PilT
LLEHLRGYEVLRPADTEDILEEIIPEKLIEEFEEEGEADFSYPVAGVGRFRVNAFRQRGVISIVMRFIPFGVPGLGDLDLPPAIADLAREERGIILVTGTTGSGKSTTLAAMLDMVNRTMPKHIVTIEDPVEFSTAIGDLSDTNERVFSFKAVMPVDGPGRIELARA